MRRIKLLLISTILLCCLFTFVAPLTHASDTGNNSRSSIEIALFGFFDPSFLYLDQGDSSILDNGNQTVEVNVSTIAKQIVNSIGATIYLERWTGSQWIQVATRALSATNQIFFTEYAVFTVTSGYYYRARTSHWTSHNGVYEQGERTTNAILVS